MDVSFFLFVLTFLLISATPFLTLASLISLIVCIILDIKKRKFKCTKWFLVIFGGFLGTVIGAFAILLFLSRAPSGKELTRNYFQHRSEFQSLVKRIQIDEKKGLERIDDTWTRPERVNEIGLTYDDLVFYRNTFKKLNVPRGFYASPNEIRFIAHTFGLSVSGSSMGYVYTKIPPKNYFKENCGHSQNPLLNIDNFQNCGGKSYTIYQKIDKNWYIFSDYED